MSSQSLRSDIELACQQTRCWADPLAGVQVMAHDVASGRFMRPVAGAKSVSGSRRELERGDTRLGVITQDPDASEFGGTAAWLEPGFGYEGVRHLFGGLGRRACGKCGAVLQ